MVLPVMILPSLPVVVPAPKAIVPVGLLLSPHLEWCSSETVLLVASLKKRMVAVFAGVGVVNQK